MDKKKSMETLKVWLGLKKFFRQYCLELKDGEGSKIYDVLSIIENKMVEKGEI